MTLSEYIGTLIAASSCAAGADILFESVGQKSDGIGKYVRLVVSLCVVCAILLPFVPLVYKLPEKAESLLPDDVSSYELSYTDTFILEATKKESEKRIKDAIYQKFGITVASADIEFHINQNGENTEAVIDGIFIELYAKDEEYAEKVRLFVSDGTANERVYVVVGGRDEE